MDESSHVRFQESDLDALDINYTERNNNEIRANEVEADVIEEEEQRVYSEVCDPPAEQMCTTSSVKRVHYREDAEPAPRPMVRRRKRRERDSRRVRHEERRERRVDVDTNEEEDGFDWLAGAAGGSNRESEVLRAMVHKLSVELGREQGRRRETGHQLAEDEESSWLTELGGLVPLLVAYEEELREVKAAKSELQQVVEKDQVGGGGMTTIIVELHLQVRLEELVEDNTEMAGQLREIAMTGPLDPEEFQALKESARLVLEENQLLREAEAEARQRLERSQVGF